ncbi:hypothetical protein BTR14_13485 [Rhizobium rhizosphaerae]|uniref:GYF domain-containing protein n=1 Tax=Xaviernesmea rhizosphaerae TaxID=1672749 RepID=A0ABX3PCQ8_9HYPH|nr:tubulin-like doman-containing protein [Xaviernesmea rhizosphaerae]OQP85792.1 hypothetical protein BTR14_13485 [Xaviernesmea rhizosphaerae]
MADPHRSDPAQRAPEERLDVMPTVFVALGGTGKEILLRLRRRILQHNWSGKSLMSLDEFPPARFVYFDTDTAEARESDKAAATDLLAGRVAFNKAETIQSKVDTRHYMTEVEGGVYPQIAEWLPSGPLDKIQSEKGAGQVRCISRLLFFDKYPIFMNLMRTMAERVTQNVTNDRLLESLGLKTTKKLRFVVVGSSAGGTGSGSFIDVGYALNSMRSPRIDQLDLFLMMPGGYRDANKDRVFANTFAALSELEYCMRGNASPSYVQRWTSQDRPEPGVKTPYSDVYIFDRQNIAGENTGVKEDLFDMVADILFEDFGSSEFASQKRTVSVNQQQLKSTNYFPELGWAQSGLFFSKGYSAVGQTTLLSTTSIQVEENLARNNGQMVRAFFGMAADGTPRLATSEERDQFLQERLRLRPKAYVSDYDARARFEHPSITDYDLADVLLMRADKSALDVTLASEIEQDIASLMARVQDHRAWVDELRHVVEMRQRDVDGRVGEGATYGPKGLEIAQARDRLEAVLLSRGLEEGSLRGELYRMLDDQERGGLEYTIDLVAKIQARIGESGTGVLARLQEAEEAYAARANRLTAEQLHASIDRLQQASQSNFLFGGGGRKSCEKYLSQARDDLIAALQARLHAIAVREAAALLRRTALFFGTPQNIDDTGEPLWSGLIGEFQAGRRRVRQLLTLIDADTSRLKDALKRGDGGTFFVIEDRGFEIRRETAETHLAWAREAFDGIGGSREIFLKLESDDGRLEILNLLRAVSNKRLGDTRQRIPSVVEAMRSLPVQRQQRLIELLVNRAAPWIAADFGRGFRPGNENYKMFIAVDGAKAFREEFDEMVRARLPSNTGLTSVAYYESGVPGRIVCYCELSGIPLDLIGPIRSEWQASYRSEQRKPDGYPLHNHWDYLRFPDPIVPNPRELEELVDRLKFFLRSVMLGTLRFRAETADRSRPGQTRQPGYWMEEKRNQWDLVGNERRLRRLGFMDNHRELLEQQLRRIEGGLGRLQFFALAALARWYADRVYTPRTEEVNGAHQRRGGIGHHAARELEKTFLQQGRATLGSLPVGLSEAEALDRLYDRIEDWTASLPGTAEDVDDSEVGRGPDLPAELRATDKRGVVWEAFTAEALGMLLQPQVAPIAIPEPQLALPAPVAAIPVFAVAPAPPPPPAAAQRFWLFNQQGQVAGPYDATAFRMLADLGQLKAEMKVCPEGGQAWQAVGEIPLLAALLVAPVAAAPPPPPPFA